MDLTDAMKGNVFGGLGLCLGTTVAVWLHSKKTIKKLAFVFSKIVKVARKKFVFLPEHSCSLKAPQHKCILHCLRTFSFMRQWNTKIKKPGTNHNILMDWMLKVNLNVFYVLFLTLKAVQYGEQVEEEHFNRTPSEKSHRPGET